MAAPINPRHLTPESLARIQKAAAEAAERVEAQQQSVREAVAAIQQREIEVEEATISTADMLGALVNASIEAEKRELTMLGWTRISGIAAVAAAVLALVAIVVTVLVA